MSYTALWRNPDLRRRIIWSLILIFFIRVLSHLPLPGVETEELARFFERNQLFGLLDLFSGGTISNFSVVLMGVGPYITASIIMQLLTVVVPQVEALSKEGEWGRQKLNQYTRLLTVPLSLIQAYGLIVLLRSQGLVLGSWSPAEWVVVLLTTSGGTMLLMWLGEIITEFGLANGISMIITIGILSGLPSQVRNVLATFEAGNITSYLGFAALALAAVALVVWVTRAERRLPVIYARRTRIGVSAGGVESHLPIRVNAAGVIPIIFALSVLVFPGVTARFFAQAKAEWLSSASRILADLLENNTVYAAAYFVLVILFTYFYTFIIFKPTQVAENLQKQGAFLPGIRPGSETTQYLTAVVNRITVAGALFLAVIAVLPFIARAATGVQTLAIGGTGLLIVVSVILETARQIRGQVVTHSYQ